MPSSRVRIINNVSDLLGDDLKSKIVPGSKVRIAASTFSIFAFEALRKELEKVSELTNAGDEVEQVRQILTLLGDQASADYLNNADLISVTDYATKYFKVFERITKVTMGE